MLICLIPHNKLTIRFTEMLPITYKCLLTTWLFIYLVKAVAQSVKS